MNTIIAHIVAMDEIHKKKLIKGLIKKLPESIKIIDLDVIQQTIYNSKEIIEQKQAFTEISQKINILKKQNNLIAGGGGKAENIKKKIKKMMSQRNFIRHTLHDIWKNKLSYEFELRVKKYSDVMILVFGFNIFPKDYRIKIPIETKNRIVFDISPEKYASNQIKYYLDNYQDRIIRGVFPIDLLKLDYLANKYEKFSGYYRKNNYLPINQDDIFETIMNIIDDTQNIISEIKKLPEYVYVATTYKAVDTIPISANTPIQGFIDRQDAIEYIRLKLTKNIPIYIYQISSNQFEIDKNGDLFAHQTLYPENEESMLLTIEV